MRAGGVRGAGSGRLAGGDQPRRGKEGYDWLILPAALHPVAAAIWLGGLAPLGVVVARAPASAARAVLARFSWIAAGCVAVIALTAAAEAAVLIGEVGGLVLAALSLTHLDLFFVPAYPTSYYHSPTEGSATSIAHGAQLFPQHCASCHGVEGRGDGSGATRLKVPPADLMAPHLWNHSDGELFWWLSHGMDGPDRNQVMPGFAPPLAADDIWALIDFVRARNPARPSPGSANHQHHHGQ